MSEQTQRVAHLSPAKKALLEKMLREQRAASPAGGIPRRERRERIPLSFSQRRLWFLSRLGESGPAYNIVSALRMKGPLDAAALESAVNSLLERHEALRTRFPAVDGEPYQEILPGAAISLAPFECGSAQEAHDCIMADAWTGFDLERGPLVRLRLYRLGGNDHILSLVMHHIISDGWTTGLMIRELREFYAARRSGSQPELAPLSIQYADFTEWQHKMLAGSRQSELLRFWQARLEGMPQVLALPTDYERPQAQTFRGRWLNFRLDPELTASIESLGARLNATPFMTLLAAFGLLLGRLGKTSDLGIGIPVANRTHPELEPLAGFFVNTLVMRLHPEARTTFLDYLRQTQKTALDAFQHQDLPFERLVEELRPERDLSRNPVVQVVFAFQQTEAMAQKMDLPDLEVEPVALNELPARFDIELHMWKADGCFQGAFIYSTDLFRPETMEAWLAHFTALLRSAVARPDTAVGDMELLSERQERERLVEWNGPATSLPREAIHELFESEAAAGPDRIAICHGDEQISYAALERRARRIARGLQDAGIGPESIVALYMRRTPAMLAALLGILKAGAAYLPLDPANPHERNEAMIADAGARLLLVDGLRPATPLAPTKELAELESSEEPLPTPVIQEQAAYVNFTSGSSGRPKGIVIPHRGVVRLVRNTDYAQVQPGETVAHASNISFDAATFEIWGALLNGGRLAIVDREVLLSPPDYSRLLRRERIDHVFMTTALFNRMVDDAPEGFAGVKNALFGGEMSDPRRVASLLGTAPPRRLLHVYGPTEATTFSTSGEVKTAPAPDALVSIGRPIANTHARVLDDHGAHAGIGAAGQLYIGGPGLALGYLGRPEETAAAFLPDPHAKTPGARLYATGDRARYRANGDLDILGRVDRQVKIRGFRIEPGEIEARMREHPGVRDAAVIVRQDPHGERGLCAFVTARAPEGAASAGDGEQVTRWKGVFEEHVYADADVAEDPLFNTTGWASSFDGKQIPTEHMRLWADDIVDLALEGAPRRALEIGCGTGMLLFRIAPHCAVYDALDFSARSLGYVRARIAEQRGKFGHVRLSNRAAHELAGYEDGSYDLVVLSSVAQYFPSLEYFRDVVDEALAKLRPGGRFVLADLRNYDLLATLHSALALFDAAAETTCEQARRKRARIEANETELCVSPSLFAAMQQRRADIANVRVRLQRTPHDNELSRYRFNVVLTKGDRQPQASAAPEVEDGRGWTLEELRVRLRPGGVYRLLNGRIADDLAAARALATSPPGVTAAEIRAARGTGVHPHDVERLIEARGLRCEIAPAEDPACFDVAVPANGQRIVMPVAAREQTAAWDRYANRPAGASSATDLGAEVREFLKRRLPPYMVPVQVAVMDALPMGPTGKVDYGALATAATVASPSAAASRTRPSDSPLEAVLCGLVADLLGLESVSPEDNFFELGGHSLLATSMAARISKAVGTDVPLKLIFEMPTVAAVAKWLRQRLESNAGFEAPPIVPAGRDRTLPASFAQRRLWFLEQMRITGTAYNMPLLLEIRGHVNAAALEAALQAIVQRHEALRTAFYEVDGEPCQRIFTCDKFSLRQADLSALPADERRERRDAAVEEMLNAPFDLTKDVLLRVTLLKMAPAEYFVAGAFHHIASDGWSVEVFVREFTALYRAFLEGQENPLEPLPIQYADFAVWQREWLQGETLSRHLTAWKRRLAKAEELRLPTDRERPAVETFRGGSHYLTIPAETTIPLRAWTNKQGATLFMTLLAGFKALMHRYTGQEHIVVGAPIANRNRGEVEGLIGFFVNSLALCTDVSGDPTFTELLARVREVALDAYTHQDLPFERLIEELQPQRYLNRNPLFQVAFALQQNKAMKPVFELPGAEIAIVELPRIDVRFDMEAHLWDDGETVRGHIVYNADLFEAATIERLAAHYATLLGSAVARPDARLSELEYMSAEELKQLEAWS